MAEVDKNLCNDCVHLKDDGECHMQGCCGWYYFERIRTKMREPTEEESHAINEYISSISEWTGVNFWQYFK